MPGSGPVHRSISSIVAPLLAREKRLGRRGDPAIPSGETRFPGLGLVVAIAVLWSRRNKQPEEPDPLDFVHLAQHEVEVDHLDVLQEAHHTGHVESGLEPSLVSAAKSEMPRQIRCSTLFVRNYFGPAAIIFLAGIYVMCHIHTHAQQTRISRRCPTLAPN